MPSPKSTPTPQVVELRPQARRALRSPHRESIIWLFAAAILLFTGILKAINLVIVLAYLLVGLWALNLWLARRAVRGLSASRLPRPLVQAGVPAEWSIEIRDDGPPAGNCILDERVGEATASWLIVRAVPEATSARELRATFPRRGQFALEALEVRSTYPFGLAGRTVRLLPPDELIVLPRPARVDGERMRSWLFHAWAGGDDERRRRRRVVDAKPRFTDCATIGRAIRRAACTGK